MTGLEIWASVATIAAVPITIAGWFMATSKKTTARASKSSTALAGDITAVDGSVAIGHGNQIIINAAVHEKGVNVKRHFRIGSTEVYTIQITAGDYWECASDRLKVNVADILTDGENLDATGFAVTLRVDTGGGIIHGGENTQYLSVNTYLVHPNNSASDKEPDSLYRYLYSEEFFSFLSISVIHVNPFKKEVTVELCLTKALKGH
jgi:hypothetical protein